MYLLGSLDNLHHLVLPSLSLTPFLFICLFHLSWSSILTHSAWNTHFTVLLEFKRPQISPRKRNMHRSSFFPAAFAASSSIFASDEFVELYSPIALDARYLDFRFPHAFLTEVQRQLSCVAGGVLLVLGSVRTSYSK